MSSLPLLLYTCAPNGEYNTVKLEPVQKDQTPQITALIDFFLKNTLAALLISFLTCSWIHSCSLEPMTLTFTLEEKDMSIP